MCSLQRKYLITDTQNFETTKITTLQHTYCCSPSINNSFLGFTTAEAASSRAAVNSNYIIINLPLEAKCSFIHHIISQTQAQPPTVPLSTRIDTVDATALHVHHFCFICNTLPEPQLNLNTFRLVRLPSISLATTCGLPKFNWTFNFGPSRKILSNNQFPNTLRSLHNIIKSYLGAYKTPRSNVTLLLHYCICISRGDPTGVDESSPTFSHNLKSLNFLFKEHRPVPCII